MKTPWLHLDCDTDDCYAEYEAWELWMEFVVNSIQDCKDPLCGRDPKAEKLCPECSFIYWWEALGAIEKANVYEGMCAADAILQT